MKLRLPHKFQAALMAALASVSFTTLSTGTLTVAAGAALLAGQQAMAEEVSAFDTLATNKALGEAIGSSITLKEMDYTNSANNSNQKSISNDIFSPDIKINGEDGWWTLTFTLKNTTDHYITLNSLLLDMTMYTGGGGNQNPGNPRSTKLTLTQDSAGAATQLYQANIVLDPATDSRLNGCYLYDLDGHKVTSDKPVLTMGDGIKLNAGASQTFTLKAERSDIRTGVDKIDAGCFFGLKDMVVNYSYELTSIPTWNGTDGHANWSDETAWKNGIPSSATPAVFDSGAAVRTVNIDTAATALSMTIDGAEYTFEGSGTLTVSGTVTVNSGAGLVLNTTALAQAMLPKVTGEGNVTLNANVTLANGTVTQARGVLTVGAERTLSMNGTKNDTYNISSFKKIVLEAGATIDYHGKSTTFNNVSLADGNASISITDMGANTDMITLAGETNLNGHMLSLTAPTSSWKRFVTIAHLLGDADSTLYFEGGKTDDGLGSKLTISSLQGFSGTLELKENKSGNPTQATIYGGTGGDVSLAALKMLGGSEATFRARESNSSTSGYTIGTVTMDAGAKLLTHYSNWNGSDYASVNMSIGRLVMNGATATVGTINHGGLVNIGSIQGSGTLTLTYESSSDVKTVFNLGGADVSETTFSGTLDVYHNNAGDKRNTTLILNDAYTAANAVVQFRAVDAGGNKRALGIGINADTVKVAGLNDGTIGTATGNNLYSLFSGSYTGLSNQYDGGTSFYSSDSTVRTLDITGTGTYSTGIKVLDNINLTMSGTGTQTFSGDMSAFNGVLTVNNGTLKFTHADGIAVSGINTSFDSVGGTLDVTGTLTLTNDEFSSFSGNLALGGFELNGMLSISNITRLDSTIRVNEGALLYLGAGTYDISGIEATGGGTPVVPTTTNGYASLDATVQFITTTGTGTFSKNPEGVNVYYHGNLADQFNDDGSVVFSGKEYSTYYINDAATEGSSLNLTTEQTAHSMLQNVVLSGTAGTITVTDERSLTGSLTQADGSTLTVAGGGSLTVGSISNNAAVSIAANTSLTSTQAEMIVGGGKTFTTSGEGTLHMNILRVDGNGANVTLGAGTELHMITTGAGRLDINGDATMDALQIGLYNAASTVNIGADATVHITGTTVSDSGGEGNASFMVSNYPQDNTLNIEGHLISEAGISSRDGSANINVADGGTLELRAGLNRNIGRSHDINVNVADGGTLVAAGYATDRSAQGLHVNLADGATLQGYYGTDNAITIAQALTLSGSSNTAVIEAADGKTLTLSGTIGGAGFTKTGTGTLVLSGNNSYTGGTVVDAGTLKAASANALGAGTLTLNAGSTLAVESGTTANVLDVTVAGSATISNAGTLVFTGKGGINVAANATVTMSGAGTYDLSGMDLEAGTGTVVYTGGAPDTTLNGFAKAAGTIDFIDITAEGSSIVYEGGASFTYKGANGTFNSSTGKVEVQAQDYDYTIFYVNEKADYVSNALVDHGVTLSHIELASGTTLNVDANIDISKIQPQAGATGYTIDVNSGSTLNITKDSDTSAITGVGTVYLSVGTEVIQGYAPTFKEGSPFTGTLVYHEGDIGNHNSYVTLDNTFQGTLELRGRMNGHAMNLGGAATLRLVGDRSSNTTGIWSQGNNMTFNLNLEVTGDNTVDLWGDATTIINGTVNSGTVKQGHLNKSGNGTMTFNGAVALAEFTTPGGTVNFEAAANIGTVNANGGSVNFKGDSTIDTLTANATANVAQGASLTLDAVNGTAANLVINGMVNVNGGTVNALNNVTLNAGGALSFGTGTATTIGGTAIISEVITNSGSLTFNGAIVIDGLDDAELTTYVDGERDSQNGFKQYSEGGMLTVVNLLGEGASMTVKAGTVVTYKGHAGTLGNNGVFTIGETSVDYSTFVVNSITETPETYSHAKEAGGETFTNVVLAAGTSFTIDAVGAEMSALDNIAVHDGATAATVQVDAVTMLGSVTTGAGLTFTGDSQSFMLGSVSGTGLLTINGPTVSIIGDNSSFAGGITVNAGHLSVTNVNALGSGPLTANEGGTIQITTSTLPDTLTVGGQGDVNLLVGKDGQDVDLKKVSAANLHLLADSTHNSRFNYKGSSNLNGVEHLYFDGGQLWLNNKDMTGDSKFTGDVTFNTATVYSESSNIFDHAAMRIGMNADFAGTVDVKVDTRLGWGNAQDKTLEISGALEGSGALELQSYNNNTRGTLKISGDASNYQGATTSHSLITLQVAEGGKMNLATGSNLAGAVQLDANSKMTVSGDSTISGAINGTGSLEVKEDATLKYNRTAETTVAAELSGEGTLQHTGSGTTNFTGDVSGFTGNVDVEAGTLNIMNIAEAAKLNVADVTIKNATMGVYNSTTATAETASEGILTITDGHKLTASGANAKLNANLVMDSGSTLDVSAYGGTGGLHMGSTITLTPGMGLSAMDMEGVANLGFMDAYDLYFDVNEFFIGNTQYSEITFASETWVKAADVFSNDGFKDGKDYYVFYSGTNPGGNGGNVGTIYIVQVPEPTTSTLSLLALAALAARRRRK